MKPIILVFTIWRNYISIFYKAERLKWTQFKDPIRENMGDVDMKVNKDETSTNKKFHYIFKVYKIDEKKNVQIINELLRNRIKL